MRQYEVGSQFERVELDISGPFSESGVRNKYILEVMDHFIRWVETYTIPNQEAKTVEDKSIFLDCTFIKLAI